MFAQPRIYFAWPNWKGKLFCQRLVVRLATPTKASPSSLAYKLRALRMY